MQRFSCSRLRASTSPKVLIVPIASSFLIVVTRDTGRSRTAVSQVAAGYREDHDLGCCPRLSAALASSDPFARGERGFSCHSPTLRPWIDGHRLRTSRSGQCPTWRSFGARAWAAVPEKDRRKQTLIASVYFRAHGSEGLSLSGGASIRSRACSS